MDIENSGTEWIQVNLTQRFVIAGVATQGRFGNNLGVEYIEEYWIEYSRDAGLTWHKWKNRKGSHVSSVGITFTTVPFVGRIVYGRMAGSRAADRCSLSALVVAVVAAHQVARHVTRVKTLCHVRSRLDGGGAYCLAAGLQRAVIAVK